MKFGGSVLDSPSKIMTIVKIIKSYYDNEKKPEMICVISAMTGVTDRIILLSEQIVRGDKKAIDNFVTEITQNHIEILNPVIQDPILRSEAREVILDIIQEFKAILDGLVLISEITPRSLDHMLSFGERLMAPIICYCLRDQGIDTKYFTGKEIGIITDSNYGEASPLMNTTKFRVSSKLVPMIAQGIVPIVTGYIAGDQYNHTTTLGRSGSDYTATIIASCIDADVVYLWSNVDGLMTADPSIVDGARVLEEISYNEAAEMVLFGAKYIHPRALEPVLDSNIPLKIRNAFNLDHPGTTITKNLKISSNIVKSIIAIRNTALLDVGGGGMVGAPGTAASIFETLANNKVNIMMISQGPSESSISIVLRHDDLGKAIASLELKLLGRIIKHLNVLENVSIVTVVGSGMRGIKGIAGRVFTAIAKSNVNVIMIVQGSSELNLAFVINDSDCNKAVRALHKEFDLDH
ncbi:MAG: aspartate kinase [Candidatus Nitrosocosmicus sp.]|nr:aspartate kinase [Candidatus Nitrosocosmicus sp. SS]KAA2283331.1 aspartate kinase [Candidatus Nitrosocosmicus sp. SS]KAF0868420.1 aspartate kinase [Candidatus Nitrosocosmicus sp. SS]MDR4491929.1 aspartate kinase [Candidatus Nitrosocosmicus sp.]